VRFGHLLISLLALPALAGCELAYPEVSLVNATGEGVLLRGLSFQGCAWEGVLAYGEATPPEICLPGADRVRFEKYDARTSLDREAADEPTWFPYQTATPRRAGYGDFCVFEIRLDDWEQDFSAPGPYGH
jgi:hypothetical protein